MHLQFLRSNWTSRCPSCRNLSVKIYFWSAWVDVNVCINETWNSVNIFQGVFPCWFQVSKMPHVFAKWHNGQYPELSGRPSGPSGVSWGSISSKPYQFWLGVEGWNPGWGGPGLNKLLNIFGLSLLPWRMEVIIFVSHNCCMESNIALMDSKKVEWIPRGIQIISL